MSRTLALGRSPHLILRDLPVHEGDEPTHSIKQAMVVRREQKRCALLRVEPPHQVDQLQAHCRVAWKHILGYFFRRVAGLLGKSSELRFFIVVSKSRGMSLAARIGLSSLEFP